MKILKSKHYLISIAIFIVVAFLVGSGFEKGPPPPDKNGKVVAAASTPPVGPGLPIGENIVVLVIVALLFGIYVIYKDRVKTKSPI
jgi:hypothetical protein